ncbi:hypothetical protein L873DRAFT_1843065 [Choiromyces venosus 120613-1]|uniref:Vps53 N-terminal domain-containing protein n=1 Tax=Choiromyces venosus 120613-1 TaxID=1336337 RepID=A0A3N4JPT8_9PEZI|nr:hypothetical protein L873DRAFT_1843065 [Choiromyces venosus 120613-1]
MFASNGRFPAHGVNPGADYNPKIHLNTRFSHPSTSFAIPSTSYALHNHPDPLDNEITQLVITQSTTNADSLAGISSAKAELADLLENIDTVRKRAIRAEDAISAMTADTKKLDSTKRNLTLSMRVLKRSQMLILELVAHFLSFRSFDQIATLSQNIADLKGELLEQVCEDSEMVFVKEEVSSRKGMLSEACMVMDALGDGTRETLDFEHYHERRFSADRMSIDTMSSREERPLIFGKGISEAFEPHISLWVDGLDNCATKQLFPMEKAGALTGEDILVVLNCAHYAHATTQQLEDKVKSKVDPEFSSKVDFGKQQDAFLGVVTPAI